MTNLEKIEREVESLSAEELEAFRKWFHAYDAALWDQQIDQDVRSGKLERLRQDALAEHESQRAREL